MALFASCDGVFGSLCRSEMDGGPVECLVHDLVEREGVAAERDVREGGCRV